LAMFRPQPIHYGIGCIDINVKTISDVASEKVYLHFGTMLCTSTMQLIHTQRVLNPTSVGKSFLLLAHINVKLVSNAKKYSHHIFNPKINPGIIITALVSQLNPSMIL